MQKFDKNSVKFFLNHFAAKNGQNRSSRQFSTKNLLNSVKMTLMGDESRIWVQFSFSYSKWWNKYLKYRSSYSSSRRRCFEMLLSLCFSTKFYRTLWSGSQSDEILLLNIARNTFLIFIPLFETNTCINVATFELVFLTIALLGWFGNANKNIYIWFT